MTNIEQKLFETGIIPVVVIDDAKDAVPLAKALYDGGIKAAEVTFRTDAAAEAIKLMSEAYPDMLVGAGTVLSPAQADKAKESGAKFIVSPGLNPVVVKHCREIGVDIIPGISSASEIEQAMSLGLSTLKFFPAEAAGGINMLKSLSAPYKNIKFMPTGGLNEKNFTDYLALDCVFCAGGGFVANTKLIKEGNFEKIKEIARETVRALHGFKVVHIGINADTPENAAKIAKQFAPFGLNVAKDGESSLFLNTDIEIMKKPWYGEKGHIAVACNNIKRAEAYCKSQGIEFIDETKKIDAKGNYKAVYINGDIAGFSVHLVQK